MRLRSQSSRPVAPYVRATAATEPEFGVDDLDKFVKQQRQKKARSRKAALGRPVPASRKARQRTADTTTRTPEQVASAPEDQLQDLLGRESVVESPTPIPDADPDLVIDCLPRPSSASASAFSDEESVTSYYGNIAILSRLSRSTLKAVLADPALVIMAGQSRSEKQQGLKDRNVDWKPEKDQSQFEIPDSPTEISRMNQVDEAEGENWAADLRKCKEDPQEHCFQRTILMSILNRHRLIYEEDGVLDFAVERMWTSRFMPTRALKNPGKLDAVGQPLWRPLPDLAIAFRTEKLIKKLDSLEKEVQKLICYEGIDNYQDRRAFHFFVVEAKKGFTDLEDPDSQCQVLNSASQSLHNMYEFFNEAGPEHLRNFFDKVRVFTAVAVARGIIIRIHRACLADSFRNETSSDPRPKTLKDPIIDGYPLQFKYDIFFKATDDKFTYDGVSSKVHQIVVQYGKGVLYELLQEAAKVVENKFRDESITRSEYYYSHFQVPPPPKRSAKGTTVQSARSQRTLGSEAMPSPQMLEEQGQQRKTYKKNIQKMHNLNDPVSTSQTGQETAEINSEDVRERTDFARLSVDDSVHSTISHPEDAMVSNQNETLPPRQNAGKRRGDFRNESVESGGPSGSTRPTRTKKRKSNQ